MFPDIPAEMQDGEKRWGYTNDDFIRNQCHHLCSYWYDEDGMRNARVAVAKYDPGLGQWVCTNCGAMAPPERRERTVKKTFELYILTPIDPHLYSEWATDGSVMPVVVEATGVEAARNAAAEHAGPEGSAVWLDKTRTSCEYLRPLGRERIIAQGRVGF